MLSATVLASMKTPSDNGQLIAMRVKATPPNTPPATSWFTNGGQRRVPRAR
ncbi:MAG: hypothetical protein BWY94_01983 [Actinobacteria bacterium ADurb.BinA094]|nr:MAG: hypothetical protein BWY94_01983 [Actinobacteria bacterium ADurb.BinA094]